MIDWIILLVLLLVAGWFVLPRLRWIAISEAAQKIEEGAVLLDVRTPPEYRQMKIPGSMNVPLGALIHEMEKQGIIEERPLLVYCASGARSTTAVRRLQGMGFKDVHNVGSYARARRIIAIAKGPPDVD